MPEPRDPRFLVVAIGGNALREPRGRAAPDEWFRALARSLPPLVELVGAGFRLVLTHGNGPQVGDELLRMELARRSVPPLGLDLCGAETQGSLGYAIQQVFGNLCRAHGLDTPVATVVTRVLVDPADPAFARPTKPIGPFYPKTKARQLAREKGWTLVEDARRGFRRVVPSPRPLRVLEADVVRRLVEGGVVPVVCGGGGVPVGDSAGGEVGQGRFTRDLTNDINYRVRGAISWDARQQTEYGTLPWPSARPGRSGSSGSRPPRRERSSRPASSRPARWGRRWRRESGSSRAAAARRSSRPWTRCVPRSMARPARASCRRSSEP